MSRTRTVTASVVAVLACALLAPPALADDTPTPTPAESVIPSVSATLPAPTSTATPVPTLPGELNVPASEPVVTPGSDATSATAPAPIADPREEADVQAQKDAVVQHADALPPSPGLSDEYLKRWEEMQVLQARVKRLEHQQTELLLADHLARKEQARAQKAFDVASSALEAAQAELDDAVRTMYMSNSAQADSLMRALGNSPEDVMRNLDIAMYLSVVGNDKATKFRAAYATYLGAQIALAQATSVVSDLDVESDDLARRVAAVRTQYQDARKAFLELVTATKPQTDVDAAGCPQQAPLDTSPVDVHVLCKRAVRLAATPQAASALKWALTRLGAPYACGGIGRMDPFRFDCSSFVSRAYADGAGLNTAGDTWAPSTRNMVPWDGVQLDRHYAPIESKQLRPGDLVLYDTCPSNTCGYKHVVMYLGFDLMAHTNACGGVSHIEKFWGTGPEHNYLGARRVMTLKGEQVKVIRLQGGHQR